jgi:glycosyltransferase involved in cell wall biosynthesis
MDRSSTHPLANNQLMTIASSNQGVFWKPNNIFYTYRELKEINLVDFILVPTNFVKDTFINNFVPTNKLIQIPYAYRPTKFILNSEKELKKTVNAILFVGYLSPRKGIMHVINAFINVNQKLPNLELWLVGDIHPLLKRQIVGFIKKNNKIKYFGILSGENLKKRYESASIFCMPSYEEGMAYVLLEAQQFNLPIISTINSGVKELKDYDQKIYIVEPYDEDKMEEYIIDIIKNVTDKNNINLLPVGKKNYMNWGIYISTFLEKINYSKN